MPTRPIDLTGARFGRLVALSIEPPKRPDAGYRWLCRCDCGTTKSIARGDLTAGYAKSCGCLRAEWNKRTHTKHGGYGTVEYSAWIRMIQRCEDKNLKAYKDYGGRGIRVCERWRHDFPAFLADMGPRPSPTHSVDRFPNNDGNYEPSNCRWATKREQRLNQRPYPRNRKSPTTTRAGRTTG
jgi:Staphylococcus phage HNH endonuclease